MLGEKEYTSQVGKALAMAQLRIRELEAELASVKQERLRMWTDAVREHDRAEKAEARVAELYHHARDEHGCLHVVEAREREAE